MWNDLRYALRTLRNAPGFTLMAVLSLALGIGANTAIFSLLDQVVLRSVPVRDPQSLVMLETDEFSYGWRRVDAGRSVFSYPMYKELRDRDRSLEGIAGRAAFPATLSWRGEASRTMAEAVTGNLFPLLGVKPALGRLLDPHDDGAPGQDPVIVLGHSYWTEKLGANPSILNSRVLMNGHPVLVVGIAPRGFRGLVSGQTPDFYAPLSMMPLISPGWKRSDSAASAWLTLFGRLKPGSGERQANAALLPLYRSILRDQVDQMGTPDAKARKRILAKTVSVHQASQGLNALREASETPLLVLMVMVGFVLLLACANVANLLVARATARQREMAVRLAIGATRWQIARQLLVESCVLALAGGVAGLLLSRSLAEGLIGLLPADIAGGWLAAQLNLRLLGYSLGLSLLTGLLFGLAPALQALSPQLAPALKEQGTGNSGGAARWRLRQALAASQICISLMLLTGAGLFTRSLVNLIHRDPGFRPRQVVTFEVDASLSGYSRQRSLDLYDQITARLRTLPGVESAGQAAFTPFGGNGFGNGIKAPGTRNASRDYVRCTANPVGPAYFRTLGIPLVAGRAFDDRDKPNSAKVAVVNEKLARFLFENENPLGRVIHVGSSNADAQIIGVVKDSRFASLREAPDKFLYLPFDQSDPDFTSSATFFVRTSGDERAMMASMRAVVRQINPNLPIDRLTTMPAIIDESIATDRVLATLAIAFGVLATVLAAVGLYGTLSYLVARRTREFGIRLVLGAEPASLMGAVLRHVGRMAALGTLFGLPAAYALARLVESQFFGVRAYDMLVLGGATLLIVVVSAAAGLVPALRAMRIEPVRALRYE